METFLMVCESVNMQDVPSDDIVFGRARLWNIFTFCFRIQVLSRWMVRAYVSKLYSIVTLNLPIEYVFNTEVRTANLYLLVLTDLAIGTSSSDLQSHYPDRFCLKLQIKRIALCIIQK
jgi:hypothetical protein